MSVVVSFLRILGVNQAVYWAIAGPDLLWGTHNHIFFYVLVFIAVLASVTASAVYTVHELES